MFALVTYESDTILYFAKHKRAKRNIRYPNQAHFPKICDDNQFQCSWNKSPFNSPHKNSNLYWQALLNEVLKHLQL